MTLGFIGCGNMGSALMRTMARDRSGFLAFDRNADNLKKVKDIARSAKSNEELAKKSEVIFLCVKPQDVGSVLDEIQNETKHKLIVSIVAGISLGFMEERVPEARCVRVMPNLPCLVGEMAAGYCFGKNCGKKDEKLVHQLLNKAGVAIKMDESKLDAITGLSGSGPAFIAYLIESFIEAGEEQGLEKKVAYELAIQTFLGTALVLKEKNIEPKKLVELISSPNGTTIAGRNVLEQSDIKEIIKKTIAKATHRSRELGKNG